jgi:hypothetical protein
MLGDRVTVNVLSDRTGSLELILAQHHAGSILGLFRTVLDAHEEDLAVILSGSPLGIVLLELRVEVGGVGESVPFIQMTGWFPPGFRRALRILQGGTVVQIAHWEDRE